MDNNALIRKPMETIAKIKIQINSYIKLTFSCLFIHSLTLLFGWGSDMSIHKIHIKENAESMTKYKPRTSLTEVIYATNEPK